MQLLQFKRVVEKRGARNYYTACIPMYIKNIGILRINATALYRDGSGIYFYHVMLRRWLEENIMILHEIIVRCWSSFRIVSHRTFTWKNRCSSFQKIAYDIVIEIYRESEDRLNYFLNHIVLNNRVNNYESYIRVIK